LVDLSGATTAVLNAQWAAVRAVAGNANLEVLEAQLDRILTLILPNREVFSAYQVSALALTQVLLTETVVRVRLAQGELAKTIADILEKFGRHTVAQNAVVAFVVATVEYGEFSEPFLKAVAPVAVAWLSAEAIECRAFAWNFFRKLKEENWEIAKRVADQGIWERFREIETVVENRYGGEMPRPQPPDTGGDAMGNAQLVQMLLALMGNRR
jgi:hypothetical protein